jgi:hypothetical protein
MEERLICPGSFSSPYITPAGIHGSFTIFFGAEGKYERLVQI